MITETDRDIIEKEESTHLRLTPEFMKSLNIDVCNLYGTKFLIIYVSKDELRKFNSLKLAYTESIGQEIYIDRRSYRIRGKLNSFSRLTSNCTVIVEKVDKI